MKNLNILWDKVSVKTLTFLGLVFLSILLLLVYFLPLRLALGQTPPFSISNLNPLNVSSYRYESSFFYGTPADGGATIDDDLIIYDSVQIRNLDSVRTITLKMVGKINGQEGWFAFSQNSVIVPPNTIVSVPFSITIPNGVCTNLYGAYLIANLESYDGMDLSGGMNVSASIATEVFFNIDSGVPCLGGEILPGLGASPAYIPNPTFVGGVPVYTSGGGIPTPTIELQCTDLIDNDLDTFVDCADSDCFSNPICDVVSPELICNDLIDNDSDTFVDCADSDCVGDPVCVVVGPELICNDLIDNDSDTFVDCADSDCAADPVCLDVFNIKAIPEKRVNKVGGNYSTRGSLDFLSLSGVNSRLEVPMGDSGISSIVNTDIASGWYKVSFKGLSHLSKFLDSNVQVIKGQDNNFDFSFVHEFILLAGDVAIGKDDFVNSMDISATANVLYKSDEHADLNLDGTVNSLDLSIEFFNLYKAGDVLLKNQT